MNTKHLIAAAIALVSSAAFAQSEIELQHFGADQTSVVSRAEVRADIQRAQMAGDLTTPSEVMVARVLPKASLFAGASRGEIRAEVMAARAELATPIEVAMFADAPKSLRSREEVRAEARDFVRSDAARVQVQAGY